MLRRLREFFRRLWRRRAATPTPVEAEDSVTTTDPSTVPPSLPPATPPVVVPPVRLRQLHVFNESSVGRRSDEFLRRIGWPSDRVWIHVWDPPAGWSDLGRRVLTIKNPNDKGTNRWDHPIADWRRAIDDFCRIARASGCSAVSIDLEGWLIQTGPKLVEHMYGAAHAVGLPLINVPMVGLNHLLVARDDNWAWTRPAPRANMTPEQVCAHLNRYTDLDVEWYYGVNPQTFIDARTYLRGLGYTVPIIPMMDGAGGAAPRIPDYAAAAMCRRLWDEFGSLGVFNPCAALGPQFIGALRELRERK